MSQELSSADKALLEEDGVSLPSRRRRKRKCHPPGDGEDELTSEAGNDTTTQPATGRHSEQQWAQVKQYMDPNPQLKGIEQGRYAAKVSCAALQPDVILSLD